MAVRKSNLLIHSLFFSICLIVCYANHAYAEKVPVDAGVINVRTQYGAAGDGITDDTDALQKAISDHLETSRIIYLPAGTYLVTNRLEWKRDNFWYAYLSLMGESRENTIIKLADNCEGFADSARPKAVIHTASQGTSPDDTLGTGVNGFENCIYDLTVDVGSGNPGAVGIDYLATDMGTIENVLILSGDGGGTVGLYFSRDRPGPCLVKNVEIQGFDYGVRMLLHYEFGITFQNLSLQDQNICGIQNDNNLLYIQGLQSRNAVPALSNSGNCGFIIMLNGQLNGGSPDRSAVEMQGGFLYARHISAQGYKSAIQYQDRSLATLSVMEYSSHKMQSLFPFNWTPFQSLNLPIEDTPKVPEFPLDQYESVRNHGAIPDDSEDDSEGLQKAIDAGKPVVYFPAGTYWISRTIVVRGNVRRLFGMGARIKVIPGSFTDTTSRKAVFEVTETTGGSVTLERFYFGELGKPENAVWLVHNSPQDMVLRHILTWADQVYRNHPGCGKLYVEDVAGQGPWHFDYPQKIWAHQISIEYSGTHIVNNGGSLWIHGLKTSGRGTIIETRENGYTELIGGCLYVHEDTQADIAFINHESNHSLIFASRGYTGGIFYENYVQETRGGETRVLPRSGLPICGYNSNSVLFRGFGEIPETSIKRNASNDTGVRPFKSICNLNPMISLFPMQDGPGIITMYGVSGRMQAQRRIQRMGSRLILTPEIHQSAGVKYIRYLSR
jgi:hypothetical protein